MNSDLQKSTLRNSITKHLYHKNWIQIQAESKKNFNYDDAEAVIGVMGRIVAAGASMAAHATIKALDFAADRIRRYQQKRRQNILDDEQRAYHRTFLASTGTRDNKDWTGIKVLGEGGQDITGMWVKIDRNNIVIDRMVMKEAYPGRGFEGSVCDWNEVGQGRGTAC